MDAFRLLTLAIPAIRNVSVWAVDLNAHVATPQVVAAARAGKQSLWRRLLKWEWLFGESSADRRAREAAAEAEARAAQLELVRRVATAAAIAAGGAPPVSAFPPILCGYFAAEFPDVILAAHFDAMMGTVKVGGAGRGRWGVFWGRVGRVFWK